MHLIITHDNTDYDAFAGCVAAKLLHPKARIALGRRVSRHVRDFLAVHRDRFEFDRFDQEWVDAVERVTVVDVRRASRLSGYSPLIERLQERPRGIELTIYDHHAAAPDDLVGDREVIAPVGSAATLLIEELQAREVDVDPVEATLLALGIHADTGSLTYGRTKPRDAEAFAWTLRHGANLRILKRYLDSPMNDAQRSALSELLHNLERHTVGRAHIGIGCVEIEKGIPDLSSIVSQTLQISDRLDALFGVFVSRRRTFVIARARVPWIDVSRIADALGGGGHPGAAAATLRGDADGRDCESTTQRLLAALEADPPRPRSVGDAMSSPVVTVPRDATLEATGETLAASDISGVPVVDGGELVGVVSRRDIDRARADGRSHLPVSSCMAHVVETTEMSASLDDAFRQITRANVGRLPVMRDNRLVGIITRTDIIAALYGPERSEAGEASSD